MYAHRIHTIDSALEKPGSALRGLMQPPGSALLACMLAIGATDSASAGEAQAALAQERPPIAEQIANTHGFTSFGQVEAIRFTFNVDSPDLKVSQAWVWQPKTDEIAYQGKDKAGNPVKLTYARSRLSSQNAAVQTEIDPAFNNGRYWLLFPLHLVWDKAAKVEDTGTSKLPLGKGSARRVVVTYPSEGGYTPGDVWEIFVGPDNRIRQLIWRRGGSPQPTVVASWESYKKIGPLLVSLDHHGTFNGKPLRLWLSDVSVRVAGSDAWMNAR